MKINFTQILVLVIVLLFAATAFAGDFATLNFIGFSKDGHYLAFEEYGTRDGSGFPFSNYYFIDTAKNAFAAPRVTVSIENETAKESAARARAAAQAAEKLKQFGIVTGNTGKLVVSHLLTDLTFGASGKELPSSVRFAEVIDSMYQEGDYELDLKSVPIKTTECEKYEVDTFMLALTLKYKSNDTSKVLQKDMTLPAGRGCALQYRIQDVYLYSGIVAVFINVYTEGFEGPDMRYMTVTGKVK